MVIERDQQRFRRFGDGVDNAPVLAPLGRTARTGGIGRLLRGRTAAVVHASRAAAPVGRPSPSGGGQLARAGRGQPRRAVGRDRVSARWRGRGGPGPVAGLAGESAGLVCPTGASGCIGDGPLVRDRWHQRGRREYAAGDRRITVGSPGRVGPAHSPGPGGTEAVARHRLRWCRAVICHVVSAESHGLVRLGQRWRYVGGG